MKEEEAATDIGEVKAEMEDGSGRRRGWGEGEGVLVLTPWWRGEAGHAWGHSHAN